MEVFDFNFDGAYLSQLLLPEVSDIDLADYWQIVYTMKKFSVPIFRFSYQLDEIDESYDINKNCFQLKARRMKILY